MRQGRRRRKAVFRSAVLDLCNHPASPSLWGRSMGSTPTTLRTATALGLGRFPSFGACLASEAPSATTATPPPRASVVAVQDSAATAHFIPNAEVVRRMVDRGIAAFSGKPTATEGWKSLLRATDTVGFKVTSGPGDVSGTARGGSGLVESLRAAGHPRSGS